MRKVGLHSLAPLCFFVIFLSGLWIQRGRTGCITSGWKWFLCSLIDLHHRMRTLGLFYVHFGNTGFGRTLHLLNMRDTKYRILSTVFWCRVLVSYQKFKHFLIIKNWGFTGTQWVSILYMIDRERLFQMVVDGIFLEPSIHSLCTNTYKHRCYKSDYDLH